MHLSGDESGAGLAHALAYIAPKSRGLLVQMEFEVYGNLHGIYYTKVSSTNNRIALHAMMMMIMQNLTI